MLSSRNKRYSWGRQGLESDLSFFRLLHQHWRPMVREETDEERFSRRAARAAMRKRHEAPKPVWSPWLWVKP